MRAISIGFVTVCVLLVGCGLGEQSVDLGAVQNVAGLVEATAPRGVTAPKLLAGASPELSRQTAESLAAATDEIRVVVRVVIDENSDILGVRVMEVRPADSALAEEYANAVSASVWEWDYEAGRYEKGYLDLVFDPQAGAN